MIDSIKGLLYVQKQHGTLEDVLLSGGLEDPLDGGEEVVDGITGGAIAAEAELCVGEVSAGFELLRQTAVDEMFECPDDDGRHADGAVRACYTLIP